MAQKRRTLATPLKRRPTNCLRSTSTASDRCRTPRHDKAVKPPDSELRDELLAREQFDTLLEAKALIESWRRPYNTARPHNSLGYRTPAPETRPAVQPASPTLQQDERLGTWHRRP